MLLDVVPYVLLVLLVLPDGFPSVALVLLVLLDGVPYVLLVLLVLPDGFPSMALVLLVLPDGVPYVLLVLRVLEVLLVLLDGFPCVVLVLLVVEVLPVSPELVEGVLVFDLCPGPVLLLPLLLVAACLEQSPKVLIKKIWF